MRLGESGSVGGMCVWFVAGGLFLFCFGWGGIMWCGCVEVRGLVIVWGVRLGGVGCVYVGMCVS